MKKTTVIYIIISSFIITSCGGTRLAMKLNSNRNNTNNTNINNSEENKQEQESNENINYKLDGYDIWLTTTNEWELVEKKDDYEYEYDLGLVKNNGVFRLYAFGYHTSEIADDMTPDNLFRENNEELISMFIDAEVIEATKKEEDENKIVYTKVYKGKIDSYNYYKTALVYFKESKESIWIEINSTPTMMESYSYMVDDIIDSIRETEFE